MLSVSLAEYQSFYADIQSEEEYAMLYERAAILLRGWTARRIDKVVTEDDFRYNQTVSAVVHTIHSLASQGGTEGVISVSNDGYSETYASAEDRKSELKSAIFEILSGTGLMGCL